MLVVVLGLGLAAEPPPERVPPERVPPEVGSIWELHQARVLELAPMAAQGCAGGELPTIEGPWLLECRDEQGDALVGVRLMGTGPAPHTRHGVAEGATQVAWPSALGIRGIDIGAEAPFDGGTARLWIAYEAEVELPGGLEADLGPPGELRIRALTLRGLERVSVEETIRQASDAMGFCVQRQAMSGPGLAGAVEFSVEAGPPPTVQLSQGSGYPLLDACLLQALQAQDWPGSGGAEVLLSFTAE